MGGTGWSLRSITIDRPAIFGGFPFGTNVALPENDMTTASSGCAVAESVTSQTVTRSLSMAGLGAAGEPAWNSREQRRRIRTMRNPPEKPGSRRIMIPKHPPRRWVLGFKMDRGLGDEFRGEHGAAHIGQNRGHLHGPA